MRGGLFVQPHFMRYHHPVRPDPFSLRRPSYFPGPFQSNIGRQHFRAGFLSRLFGRHDPVSYRQFQAHPFYFGPRTLPPVSGSSWQSWLNPERLTHFLGQTQQFLHTGQQVISLYQQYGPLIRNLPALWKMYRSMLQNDAEQENENTAKRTDEVPDDVEENETKDHPETEEAYSGTEQESKNDANDQEATEKKPVKENRERRDEYTIRESIPKLYI